MRPLTALAVCAAVSVGLFGSVAAVRSRGGQEAFRYLQARALGERGQALLSAADVQRWVARAPEPVRPSRRTAPVQVSCRPGSSAVLRNPWSCTIRYRSGTHAHYRVVVHPNGFYVGVGTGIIEGCCVRTPTSG